ncbi:MAG TPA: cyclic nucleotide-binding domain-containing protein [Syntrophales bacterium]|nr:cyclic nucleotide-binding domain-containing protein [Syntrophales bacterium]
MFQVASYETYPDGKVIFEEGSHGDWIYVVEEGAVEISKKDGERKVVIEVLKPGDLFGELAYIAKIARTATAAAVGETVIGILDRDYFDREFNKLPGDFQVMFKTVALRLKATTEKVIAPNHG